MTISKQQILAAYHSRHACKQYDPSKKVSEEDMHFIVETGRLSPSSFGFEPWHFVVIENPEIRNLIAGNAWGAADKARDCSYLVLFLVRNPQDLRPGSDYINHHKKNVLSLPEDVSELYSGFFKAFSESDFNLDSDRAVFDWACKQSYIALGNMLTAAAMVGVDSTPIEGFNREKLSQVLAEKGVFDRQKFSLSVMAAFGYRSKQPREKHRQSFDSVATFIK